jgi:hypothetical protein
MTIYRRLTFIVADMSDDEDVLLMPAVLTTLGAVGTPWIGGTGIMLLDIDESPLSLSEIEVPVPLVAQADVVEFPATFASADD